MEGVCEVPPKFVLLNISFSCVEIRLYADFQHPRLHISGRIMVATICEYSLYFPLCRMFKKVNLENLINSAGADGGPHSRVCAR